MVPVAIVTESLEQRFDFSNTYYQSGLAIVIHADNGGYTVFSFVKVLWSLIFPRVAGLLVLVWLVAGLLATEEKCKVLVLEKEDYVGGRLVSFVAENDTLKLHGKSLDHKKFKKVMASVYAWVARSEPDMETMLKEKLLDGYSFEAGGHATLRCMSSWQPSPPSTWSWVNQT